jgi:hypothetical protein
MTREEEQMAEYIDTLGIDVARKCTWDGTTIVAVMMAALTDANFHSLRSRFEDAYNNYLEEAQL